MAYDGVVAPIHFKGYSYEPPSSTMQLTASLARIESRFSSILPFAFCVAQPFRVRTAVSSVTSNLWCRVTAASTASCYVSELRYTGFNHSYNLLRTVYLPTAYALAEKEMKASYFRPQGTDRDGMLRRH